MKGLNGKTAKAMSLREWISLLESEGELKRITAEVDWNMEIGSITRRALTEGKPALLFENIKDYKSGRCTKLFTGGVGSKGRLALALGLPKEASSFQTIVRTIKQRFRQPIAPKEVSNGAVKENIIKGDSVDLYEFPVPVWNTLDGGRYINTAGSVITRDPETGRINIGTYRGMILDKNSIGILLVMTANWGKAFAKYRAMKKPMPVAVVYGFDPVLFITASTALLLGMPPKYEMAGGLRQAPIELVKAETSDLLVPSDAEIVVEGYISTDPNDVRMEGPFGEYTGFSAGLKSPKPFIRVTAITHRNDLIFRGAIEGSTPGRLSESPFLSTPSDCAALWNMFEDVGVPGVTDVWGPISVAGPHEIRVSIKKAYRGHAKQVAFAIWGSGMSPYIGKYVIVVDDDIDIHDPEAVSWAISSRANPAMDAITLYPGTHGSVLDASVPLKRKDPRKYGQGSWTRVLIDATVNWELEPEEQFDGKREPPLTTMLPKEQEELIGRRWKEYGFE